MKKSRLTTWEAACIITGYGIGGGVLSLPYLAEKTGLLWSFAILIAALLASYLLHLMIADLALHGLTARDGVVSDPDGVSNTLDQMRKQIDWLEQKLV